MHKKLLFIALTWLCAIAGMADTLTIVSRFEKIEHASVLASYRNEFGSYRKPDLDVEFPYALIRVHIDGNKEAVTQAKELFALYLGQHYTTKAKNISRVNEIMFLVPVGAGHVELQCGDGCQPLVLFDNPQLTADAIYEGKVRYAMEKATVQPEPDLISRQFFKFRVSPADAMVEVDENGKKEIWKVVDGVARKALYHGNYAYSVSANRYYTKEGVITVSDANTETTIVLKPRFGWLSITGGSEANGASVYATNTTTGVRQSLGIIPLTKVELDAGEYTLLILQDKYKDYSSLIQISENNETSIRPTLAPNFARLTLRAATGSDILIDEQQMGTGSWTGTLELGDYLVETRQTGHRSAYTNITVTASSEGKIITLNQPTPIYGSLMVDGLPADATVYVDDVKKGLTPMIVNKLLIGSHKVRIEKEGYDKQEKTVTITEGQETVSNFALTKTVKPTPAPSPTPKSNNNIENGHEYVDLGLSVKWATCNVGANKPEEYGDYFAWGETEPKRTYDWRTYKWCNGKAEQLTKYNNSIYRGTVDGKTILGLEDDAARANWGGSWRMPTAVELNELLEQCIWTRTTQNGVEGYKVTSKINGNSIFFPAAGSRFQNTLYYAGSYGQYWSSSINTRTPSGAFYVKFDSAGVYMLSSYRDDGQSVRPVCP